jgi:hypothetical protein
MYVEDVVMDMEEKEIKSALDSFENDDFLSAKEKLKTQILAAKNSFLKNKLGLTKDVIDLPVKVEPKKVEAEPKKVVSKPARRSMMSKA